MVQDGTLHLSRNCGLLVFGERHENYVDSIISGFENDRDPTVDFRVLDGDEMKRDFPMVAHGGKRIVGCVDNQAGVLYADKCLEGVRVSDYFCTHK